MKDCLFCKIAAGEIPADVIYSDKEIVAFKDINPMAPHHVLIIPRDHIATILDLTDEQTLLSGKMTIVANQIARDIGLDNNGYRLVYNCKHDGGQEVYHIHLHLLGGRKMKWPPG